MEAPGFVRKVFRRLDRAVGTGPQRVFLYSLVGEGAVPNLNPAPGLAVSRLLPDQMPGLKEVFPSFAMSELQGEQRRQSQCYAAWLNGRLVHYSWVQTSGSHRIQEAGRSVDMKPGEFWIYDCRTNPSARGLGVYPYVLSFISREHLRDGSREGVIYTTEENVASQHGILKAGFQLKEILRSLRFGRRYYAR